MAWSSAGKTIARPPGMAASKHNLTVMVPSHCFDGADRIDATGLLPADFGTIVKEHAIGARDRRKKEANDGKQDLNYGLLLRRHERISEGIPSES